MASPRAVVPVGQPASEFLAGDPIRGIAAFTVVTFHIAFFAVAARPGSFPVVYGSVASHTFALIELAYYVFFALSGFLISRPFVRSFVLGRPRPSLGRYARSRALRLIPAFWVVFTLLLLWHGTLGATPLQVAAIYGFAQSFEPSGLSFLVGPAWTLQIEAGFYILVPVAAVLAQRLVGPRLTADQRVIFVIVASAGVAVLSLGFRELVPQTAEWQRSAAAMLYTFCPGVALAALDIVAPRKVAASRHGAVLAPAIFAVALVGTAVYVSKAGSAYASSPRLGVVYGVASLVSTGGMLAAVLLHQWRTGACPPGVDSAPMRWLGTRSYSFYIAHQGILLTFFASGYPDDPWVRFGTLFVVAMPCCLFAAWVGFALLERPFINRGRRPPARA